MPELTDQYSGITGRIIGAAMAVHRELGNGFPEVICQRALALELTESGLLFQRELTIPVFYKGTEVGARRVDFLVKNQILVELKAVGELTDTHFAQTLNYLNAYQLPIALLINFGETSLRFRRLANSRPRPRP